jgi:hypothetical protein
LVTVFLTVDGAAEMAEFCGPWDWKMNMLQYWNQHQACRLLQFHGHSDGQDTVRILMRRHVGWDKVTGEMK